MEKDRLKTLSTIAGIIFGLVGISVAAFNLLSERSRLEVQVAGIGWSSPTGEQVIAELETIESERGQATAGLISDLKEYAAEVEDWTTPDSISPEAKTVRMFREKLQEAIKRLQDSNQYDWESVEIRDTFVTWPRGEKLQLRSRQAQDISLDLVKRALAGSLSIEDKEKLQREALPLLRGEDSREHDRAERLAVRDLRSLRQRVEEVTEAHLRRVAVTLRILNRSRLPNYILSHAVMVGQVSTGAPRVVPLKLRGSGSIDRFASITAEFESAPIGKLGQDAEGLRDGQKCAIAFKDIRGKEWVAQGELSVRVTPEDYEDLERAARRVLEN